MRRNSRPGRWRTEPQPRQQVDFGRINDRARACLPGLCQWLFPAGVREGGEFVIGSLRGEAGRSLKIRLDGPRAGIWHDFATSYGGRDPVSLVAAVTGAPQHHAARALARRLAIAPWRRP